MVDIFDLVSSEPEVGTWVASYQKAIAQALVTKGKIGERTEYGFSYDEHMCAHYGLHREHYDKAWADPEHLKYLIYERLQHHGQAVPAPQWCGRWKSILNLREEHTSEFADTFSPNREFVRVTATVSCSCGYITDREIERDSTFSELIAEVVR